MENTRKGWLTLIKHQVTKINFSNSTSVPHVATGIEFGASDGTGGRFVAYARKEVILAAGAIQVCLFPPRTRVVPIYYE